jgi:hypothetical protein
VFVANRPDERATVVQVVVFVEAATAGADSGDGDHEVVRNLRVAQSRGHAKKHLGNEGRNVGHVSFRAYEWQIRPTWPHVSELCPPPRNIVRIAIEME